MPDLAVIIVSTNEASWLERCLPTVFAHAGGIELEVVVADNESTDDTPKVVAAFPAARVVRCPNHGFSHANNRALETTDAPYALFLNPDTEILDGTFGELVAYMHDAADVGLVGVRQVASDGELLPTIRRFPSLARWTFEALGSERFPFRASWLGERELDMAVYDKVTPCDWTSGSFMLARRDVLDQAGWLDERFFIYSEEVDLCYRVKAAGWAIHHVPSMTILHHANKAGVSPRMLAQEAYARRQYAQKHLGQIERRVAVATLVARYGVRAIAPGRSRQAASDRRVASRSALRTLLGIDPPPFAALTLPSAGAPRRN